jgi:alpha 1,3-glucosidase
MARYSLLPLWYTVFYEAYSVGIPVMRTMFTEFPDDELTFTMDDQWMIGDTLLVKPVTDSGKNSVDVYLPGNDQWFDFNTLQSYTPSKSKIVVDAPLEKIPVFIRGGKILSRKMRLRRSSKLMFFDPYTLTITPDASGKAAGKLYMDDEISLAHESHKFYSYRQFTFENNVITCSSVIEANKQSNHYEPVNTVERIEIAGQDKSPTSVSLKISDQITGEMKVIELQSFYDNTRKVITIKKPDVLVAKDWEIILSF